MTLSERYHYEKHKNPFWGDIPILRMSIQRGDSKRTILRAFNKFVSLDDYALNEKHEILTDLYSQA